MKNDKVILTCFKNSQLICRLAVIDLPDTFDELMKHCENICYKYVAKTNVKDFTCRFFVAFLDDDYTYNTYDHTESTLIEDTLPGLCITVKNLDYYVPLIEFKDGRLNNLMYVKNK